MLEIVRRRPEHDAEIFELYASVFGPENLERSRRRFSWQYFDNPNNPEDGPVMWMAREHGALLGQMATMPFPMWWIDREVRASAGMDYFVRKEAQGKGIGIALSNRWADEVDVALAMGLTPSSYPLFRKIFRDVGPIASYVKPLDGFALARNRLGPALGALAGPFAHAAVKTLDALARGGGGSGVAVSEASTLTEEYDDLWTRARSSYRTIVRRDAKYLDWKYRRCPFREYRILEARRAGTLVGYATVREEGRADFRRGVIADLFCDTADLAAQDALIEGAVERFRRSRLARAEIYCMNRRLGAALQRHGFRSGTTAVQYCVAYRGADASALDDLGNWQMMIGDGDLDRG
jgi:GNAT superfamily N-acetyltransferase